MLGATAAGSCVGAAGGRVQRQRALGARALQKRQVAPLQGARRA